MLAYSPPPTSRETHTRAKPLLLKRFFFSQFSGSSFDAGDVVFVVSVVVAALFANDGEDHDGGSLSPNDGICR